MPQTSAHCKCATAIQVTTSETVVPQEVIMKLVSTDLFRKYSDLNLQQFVDSQDNIKWCPYPDCGQAAQLQAHHQYKPVFGTAQGINVECGNGHGFCW